MIDTKELRRLLNSTDVVDGIGLHANIKPIIRETLDRLEAAERAVSEAYARGYATGREEIEVERDALRAELSKQQTLTVAAQHIAEVAQIRANQLQAKIEAMEKRLRLILEEPENTMSNSKALREMVRQARLALGESK